MPSLPLRSSLKRKIMLVVALGMLLMFAALGISSWLAMDEATDRVLQERLVLAQTTAGYLDHELQQDLARLENVSFAPGLDIAGGNLDPARAVLRDLYFSSIFKDGVLLVDSTGAVLCSEPDTASDANLYSYSHVALALKTGKPVISDVFSSQVDGTKMVAAVVPFRDRNGKLSGAVVGQVDLVNSAFADIIQPVTFGRGGYVEIVDGQGTVLASTQPERVLQSSDHSGVLATLIKNREGAVRTCHSCHESAPQLKEKEVMAFTPLATVSWGVAVRQSESEALAPARNLRNRFIGFSSGLLAVALVLAWGLGRSLSRPLEVLNASAERISKGDLSAPIPDLGDDEIGRLGRSFDTMRVELKKSLEKTQQWNRELEEEVKRRTRQLQESYQEIQRKEADRGELLHKVINAQEEERKRIARELHDDTSQALAALLMALDDASKSGKTEPLPMDSMKNMAAKALDGVHQMIFDLRPAVLDDLGLVSALRWYAESRLAGTGIKPRLEVSGGEPRLPTRVETALFRVIQEAISNVAKHSKADNVIISLEFTKESIRVEVEDDGEGFDLNDVSRPGDARGLGLMGMRERISLLEGKFDIESEPGGGTVISIELPLPQGGENGQDTSVDRR